MSTPDTDAAAAVLDNVRNQYAKLRGTYHFSLQDLFCPDHFRLDAWCHKVRPHPQGEALNAVAESFGKQYGIWFDNARHHTSTALFLYPEAEPLHLLNMMKNLTTAYYLHDTMGGHATHPLSTMPPKESAGIKRRVGKYDPRLTMPGSALPIEFAHTIVLRDIRDTSQKAWFTRFHELYAKHLSITLRKNIPSTPARIPALEEYIEQQIHYTGMHHMVMWIEYANNEYLDWSWLSDAGLDDDFRKLIYAVSAFSALSNDLFSFEKEVIRNGTVANLMMVVALNGRAYSLTNIIRQSTTIIRGFLEDYLRLSVTCRKRVQVYGMLFPNKAALLERYLTRLERCMQAYWVWQAYTKLYKFPDSIWLETTIHSSEKIMG